MADVDVIAPSNVSRHEWDKLEEKIHTDADSDDEDDNPAKKRVGYTLTATCTNEEDDEDITRTSFQLMTMEAVLKKLIELNKFRAAGTRWTFTIAL